MREITLYNTLYTKESVEIIVNALEFSPVNKTPHRGSEYESINLPLYSTTYRKLTLLNDTNTVPISYGTRTDHSDPIGNPYAQLPEFSYVFT